MWGRCVDSTRTCKIGDKNLSLSSRLGEVETELLNSNDCALLVCWSTINHN